MKSVGGRPMLAYVCFMAPYLSIQISLESVPHAAPVGLTGQGCLSHRNLIFSVVSFLQFFSYLAKKIFIYFLSSIFEGCFSQNCRSHYGDSQGFFKAL